MSQIKVKCSYDGCEEVQLYDAINMHLLNCGNQLISCDSCQLKILWKLLPEHKEQFYKNFENTSFKIKKVK